MAKYIVEVLDHVTEWIDFDINKFHRLDGPAREWTSGIKEWWVAGNRHRIDGPAVEFVSGSKLWYQNGKKHRIDGPAIEMADGDKEYWIAGKRHRIDGPAIEWSNGDKEYWIDDVYYTEQEFNARTTTKELTVAERN